MSGKSLSDPKQRCLRQICFKAKEKVWSDRVDMWRSSQLEHALISECTRVVFGRCQPSAPVFVYSRRHNTERSGVRREAFRTNTMRLASFT